eukprot:3433635-Pyramimonas_sp.AAC.1
MFSPSDWFLVPKWYSGCSLILISDRCFAPVVHNCVLASAWATFLGSTSLAGLASPTSLAGPTSPTGPTGVAGRPS